MSEKIPSAFERTMEGLDDPTRIDSEDSTGGSPKRIEPSLVVKASTYLSRPKVTEAGRRTADAATKIGINVSKKVDSLGLLKSVTYGAIGLAALGGLGSACSVLDYASRAEGLEALTSLGQGILRIIQGGISGAILGAVGYGANKIYRVMAGEPTGEQLRGHYRD